MTTFPLAKAAALALVAALAALSPIGAARADDPAATVKVPTADPAMLAAFVKAAATVDQFLDKWRDPPPGAKNFAVKVGLGDVAASTKYYRVALPGDVGDIEWFWLVGLSEDGDGFSAKVSNPPDVIHNVSQGQPIHFTKKNIGDWMYFQDGKIVGNVTACPALAHASAEEREMFKTQYGLACD